MDTYDFVSKTITEQNVKDIIRKAKYDPAGYKITPRVDRDGYVARGDVVMSLTSLRNAANDLKIKVEISSPANEDGNAAAATNYEVDITMSKETADTLRSQGYYLYGFKAVQTTQEDGAPLAWFCTQTYSTFTQVQWSESYEAYTSSTDIGNGVTIAASFTTPPILLGQTLNVDQPDGTGEVVDGGVPHAISINNTLGDIFTCGISQQQDVDGQTTQLCAFPLNGFNQDVIAPIEVVVLMFATGSVDTGTVIFYASGPGIQIDMTGAPQRSVSYDLATGWDWDDASWGQGVGATADLVPLLINPSVASMVPA